MLITVQRILRGAARNAISCTAQLHRRASQQMLMPFELLGKKS
jgi:hypothetical protein